MAETGASDSSPDTDRDFDVSAEMMVHDYDDEQTLEEEEQNDSGEGFGNNELDELAQDAEIPMEDLLAMYLPPDGGVPHTEAEEEEDEEEEELTNEDEELTNGETEGSNSIPSDVFTGSRESTPARGGTRRLLRSSANPDEESESGSEDSDYVPVDDWKKCISVGSDFQANVPEGLSQYDDAPVYENEDRLLWDPSKLQAADVERFLSQVHQPLPGVQGLRALPLGSHMRDDERSLFILLQCGHNVEEALRRHRMQMAPPADEMSLWSEEECRNFESGLRTYGKNFHLIHQHKVRTRSVGELVQFYYLWKKTARHDVFANQSRLAKKKYHLHPGITDYMDRFLDDIDNSMSPPPAQSLLDKNRMHKPHHHHHHHNHHQVSILSLNGVPVPDMQNCSPAVGGLASGDLPHEPSASGSAGVGISSYNSAGYHGSHSHANATTTRPMPMLPEDGVPPAKKQRLKDSDLSVLENLNNFLDSNGGMNLTNSATEQLLTPLDAPVAASVSAVATATRPSSMVAAHNLQNMDPSAKNLLQSSAAVALGSVSGLKGTESLSSREKLGSVVSSQ